MFKYFEGTLSATFKNIGYVAFTKDRIKIKQEKLVSNNPKEGEEVKYIYNNAIYELTILDKYDSDFPLRKIRIRYGYENNLNNFAYIQLTSWNRIKMNIIHNRYWLLQDGKIQNAIWFVAGILVTLLLTRLIVKPPVYKCP